MPAQKLLHADLMVEVLSLNLRPKQRSVASASSPWEGEAAAAQSLLASLQSVIAMQSRIHLLNGCAALWG